MGDEVDGEVSLEILEFEQFEDLKFENFKDEER